MKTAGVISFALLMLICVAFFNSRLARLETSLSTIKLQLARADVDRMKEHALADIQETHRYILFNHLGTKREGVFKLDVHTGDTWVYVSVFNVGTSNSEMGWMQLNTFEPVITSRTNQLNGFDWVTNSP